MEPANETRAFLGDEPQWSAAQIELDDVQGLWGGRRIRVTNARAVVQIVERGMFERRYEFELEQVIWQGLLEAFVQNDFVSVKPPERSGLPDEAHPTISLTNAAGESRAVAKWAGVKDERFDAIYTALAQIETLIQGLEPIYSGSFTPGA